MKVFLVCCLVLVLPVFGGGFEDSFRKEVGVFLDGLGEERLKGVLLDMDEKERWVMQYTGGKHPGVRIGDLTDEERKRFEKVLRMVLSDYGWEMANKVAKQDGAAGLGKYWVACFGDPRKGGDFAFRVVEHHLTVVHLVVKNGETGEFGPILLGADPAVLWRGEEEALLKLWKVIGDEKALVKGRRGVASQAMKKGDGLAFGDLSVEAQGELKRVWAGRLRVFTPAVQAKVNGLLEKRGGWGKSRVAFYHEVPGKRCVDGGRWDFKCGVPGLNLDFEGSRGHVHMSLWAR